MIISTLEELRLYSPANAIDNIETLRGFLDSSEHDVLTDKLGTELYDRLNEYYTDQILVDPTAFIGQMTSGVAMPPYATLLSLAQRIVTYDALGRAIDMQAVSVNGAGVNVASADDYKTADQTAIAAYKKACVKETHTAINRLLVQLEEWYKRFVKMNEPASIEENSEDSATAELTEIATLWQQSRYFYLAAQLVIPSATVLQEYYNIYDSRERFITLLPDLRYIQEDVLAPIIGDELMDHLALCAASGRSETHTDRILHLLRKVTARHLEARLLKPTDPRQQAAYNEAIKLTDRLTAYLQLHQPDFPDPLAEAFATSPLYVQPAAEPKAPRFRNNQRGNAMFVTPGLT